MCPWSFGSWIYLLKKLCYVTWKLSTAKCTIYIFISQRVSGYVMVFNVTFNNISVISWWSVLLVEETEKTTDLSEVTDKLYHIILNRVHLLKIIYKLLTLTKRWKKECVLTKLEKKKAYVIPKVEQRQYVKRQFSFQKTLFDSSWPPIVCRRTHFLFYVICVCLPVVVSNTSCVVCFLFCLPSSCWQFLWIVLFWLPFLYSLSFII